jgi:hypothetical protein
MPSIIPHQNRHLTGLDKATGVVACYSHSFEGGSKHDYA